MNSLRISSKVLFNYINVCLIKEWRRDHAMSTFRQYTSSLKAKQPSNAKENLSSSEINMTYINIVRKDLIKKLSF